MKTTNKCFTEQIQGHILNALSEDHGNTTNEQLASVIDEFKSWYGPYEQRQHPNHQEAFTNWMDGLPSVLNTEYEYYQVNNTMKTWYETCGESYKEPKDSTKEYQLYKNLVYRELNTLFKQHDLRLF